MSSETGIPLIGCASHKFNLAVEAWISSTPELSGALNALSEVMRQLKTLTHSARLHKLTHLEAIKPNASPWNSRFDMVSRYFRISDFICQNEEVECYMPSAPQKR